MKYETVRYNLTPVVEGPFVGYGKSVDDAWDSIANDSRFIRPKQKHKELCTDTREQWVTR